LGSWSQRIHRESVAEQRSSHHVQEQKERERENMLMPLCTLLFSIPANGIVLATIQLIWLILSGNDITDTPRSSLC
jgi:hypothetical protein